MPMKANRKIVFLLIALFVLLLLAGTYLFFFSGRQGQEIIKKLEGSPLPKSLFVIDPNTGQALDEETTTLKFVSKGAIVAQDLRNKENVLFAKVYYLEGVTRNTEGDPREIKVVIQASLENSDKNVYYQFLQDIVEIKRLAVTVDEKLLDKSELEIIFENGTVWNVSFYNKPLNPKNPFIDPNSEITQLISRAEDLGFIDYEDLTRFINSGMSENYNGFIFPDSLYVDDFQKYVLPNNTQGQ